MKIKYFILVLMMVILCGCQTINNTSIDTIINGLNNTISKTNTFRTGYSYYLPNGLTVKDYSLYNETIESEDYTFYLYVDLVSYYNNIENNYEICDKCYYSKALNIDKKNGYLEINLKENNQYLIEIMFNYAKIEVMVDEANINYALSYAVTILKSVIFNDNIVANLLGEDILNYQEEVYDIFNTVSTDSNYLKALEQDQYEEPQTIKDTDLIN